MNKLTKITIIFFSIILFICGFLIVLLRGSIPTNLDFHVSHKSTGTEHIRTEIGYITEDYRNQYIAINTIRQHLYVYVDNELILSSRDYYQNAPYRARYGIDIRPEFINKEMRIELTADNPKFNDLMSSQLSFQRINKGNPAIDYGIIGICVATFFIAIFLLSLI